METQNQIKRTLSQPVAIKYICSVLDSSDNLNRATLADQICEKFGFFNPQGEKQNAGCQRALRELEKQNHFTLPASNATGNRAKRSPRRLNEPVPLPQGVPDSAGKIQELKLILVKTEEQMRTWNELMIQEHPRGAALFVGQQIRYLVQSAYGFLGGFSFSAAALNLCDRDKWIGWNLEERRTNLHHVVNMSRFLVRPSISCRNLASLLLGMAVKQFPGDFEKRYGHRPLLLESFVDTSTHTGTCYKAANWIFIGLTKGRGRHDRYFEYKESKKDIYVYQLEPNFRDKLGLPEDAGKDTLKLTSGLDNNATWAENEFGGAPLGDKRLSQRLVEVADDKWESPGASYSRAANGTWSKVKAYYRLIDKPDDSAVTMTNILQPHREQTIRRMMDQSKVLCIDDGCELNYNNLDKCKGLGVIGTNQTKAKSKGLHLHSTIATTTEGLPLGVLRSKCTAPELKSKDDKRPVSAIPIEEKNTFSWIEGLRDCSEIKRLMPHTSLIKVMDREADFFELFDEQRCNCSNVEVLVRAKHDRNTSGECKLFESARQSPVQAQLTIQVPRQSARSKKSKQKAKPKRKARNAEVSLRYTQVELNPPRYYKDKDPITLTIICVVEDNPPANVKPLEWFLLTTIDVTSSDDAICCVKWYCLRWRIEDWHRVLKSGCKIEDLAHETAERLKRAIAINMVIAWRIMLMTLLGRETPELPPEVLFSDLEIKVLTALAKKKD